MLRKGNYTINVLTAVAVTCSSMAALAEDVKISDGLAPGDSASKWVVGGAVGAFENPFIGEDSTDAFIVPNVEYRGEKLFFKDGELGYNLYRNQGFGVGVILSGNGSYLSDKDNYDDNDELDGIKERDGTLDAGFYLIHNSDLGQLRVKVLEEITGEHDGQSIDANYTFDLAIQNWHVNPVVGVAWASGDSVDHFFGVSEEEATQNRTAYKGESAASIYTGVSGRYEFAENWDVNVGAYYVKLGSGISDSSLIEKDDLVLTSVGVNYNF